MRIRTQIILAAFVLAVVPLAAIVTYSYHSSRRALESASRRETDRLTRQMDRRLASIRADLDQRLAVVSALPLPATSSEDGGSIATVLGEAASFVDALEFHPILPAEPRDVDPDPDPNPDPQPQPRREEPPQVASAAPAPPPVPQMARDAPRERIVIDLPPMPHIPRYVMSEEHRELIAEISKLGAALGNAKLDPEEREDIRQELKEAQEELRRVVTEERVEYQEQVQESVREARRIALARREARREAENVVPSVSPAPPPDVAATATTTTTTAAAPKGKPPEVMVRKATTKEIEKSAADARKSTLILGRRFQAPVRNNGELVGQLTARISPEQVIRRVLGGVTEDGTEVPFALDREGTVYTRSPQERAQLDRMGIIERVKRGDSLNGIHGWIVTTSTDPQSGLKVGVARPVADNLEELRRTAARNFALGLGLIAFALVGIVPLSNHLTRDVKIVTEGAERIAHGDLMTRVPVKTKNELGQLARAFNRMAEDLSMQQQRLVEQERTRKEQELQQRLLAVEYDRKSFELEEARRFQLSMLPKNVPHHPRYQVAVYTRTATEVGGDYYDFHLAGDVLSVTIGDATGHGAKAGTMVTVVKTLFAGYSGTTAPAEFLRDAAEKIKRMELGRMAMALSIGRFERDTLTLSSAGMPPVLVHRAGRGVVEEVALSATPLGTLGTSYDERRVNVDEGDTVLFLTDGFPELMNDAGQQLGYATAADAFADAAKGRNAGEVIDSLAAFAARWHGEAPPNDDVTFVIVRIT